MAAVNRFQQCSFSIVGLAWLLATTMFAGPLTHSHNDYEQTRPLHDALAAGLDSIEADVWLIDGQLLVAHEYEEIRPGRTLASLYLDPLREHLKTRPTRSLILLIDVKTEADSTWRAIDAVLAKYPDLSGQVRFIISGNRARGLLAAASPRRAVMDGRLEDLADPATADWIPLISDNWTKYFSWRGDDEFPAAERVRLDEIVTRTHAQGRLLRFWAAPDRPEVWRVLRAAGVSVIGTDHLAALRRFLDTP